jgi:hypothetical protein
MKKYLFLAWAVVAITLSAAHPWNDTWIGNIDASGLTTFKIPGSSTNGQVLVNSSGQIAGKALYGAGSLVPTMTGSPVNVCAEYNGSGILGAAASGLLCGSGGGGGTVGTPTLSGGGSTVISPRSVGIAKGTISISGGTFTYPGGSVAAASSNVQAFNIVTGLNGDLRYPFVMITEHVQWTQGASVTNLTAGMGRSTATPSELMGPFRLMQSGGDVNFGTNVPAPPIIGTGNTYNLQIVLTTTGGLMTDLTTGQLTYEIHAYSVN